VRFGRRSWVRDLAVDPARCSSGIGKALLDAAKPWAKECGATHLELDTGLARTKAQRFYERQDPLTKGIQLLLCAVTNAPRQPCAARRSLPDRGAADRAAGGALAGAQAVRDSARETADAVTRVHEE
jgi:hypothetical protein